MFQRPVKSFIEAIHALDEGDEPFDCAKETHSAADAVQCFINRKYRHQNFVPKMFIPSCGQVSLPVVIYAEKVRLLMFVLL